MYSLLFYVYLFNFQILFICVLMWLCTRGRMLTETEFLFCCFCFTVYALYFIMTAYEMVFLISLRLWNSSSIFTETYPKKLFFFCSIFFSWHVFLVTYHSLISWIQQSLQIVCNWELEAALDRARVHGDSGGPSWDTCRRKGVQSCIKSN